MSTTHSSPDLDSAARESLIFARLQAWDKAITSGPEIGILCREVRDTPLWPYRTDPETAKPCTSWTRWMHVAAPRAASTAFGYLRQVEALSDIPDAVLGQIRGENVDFVMHLSTAIRAEPEVLEAAQTEKSENFKRHVRETHPDQHFPEGKTLKFFVEDPDLVLEVVREAMEDHDAMDKGHALVLIVEAAHELWQMKEQVAASIDRAQEAIRTGDDSQWRHA